MSGLSALSVQFVRVHVLKTEGVYAVLTEWKKYQKILGKYLRIKGLF